MKNLLWILIFASLPAAAEWDSLISWVRNQRGITAAAPEIQRTTRQELARRICTGQCQGVVAVYSKNLILLRDDLQMQDLWDASYMIHELSHWADDVLQIDQGWDCDSRFRSELRAYELQNQWLQTQSRFIPRRQQLILAQRSAGCESSAF